jgi:oligogalacturonide transporter
MAARVVRPHHYVAYGLTDILGAGSMAVQSAWVVFFYTTYCGLTIAQATGIFVIARLLDAIWSPLVGHISDRFGRTWFGRKFGRRRGVLLLAIPFLPSFALLWVSGQHYLYYLVTFVFFELVYATVLIPYETLAAEMTDDYRKKAQFAGARILVGQMSAILASILPALIIDSVGGKDSPQTFLIMGVIFAALFVVVVLVTYLFTWERERPPDADAKAAPKTSLAHAFVDLYRNIGSTLRIRAFRLHLGMYLGGYISQDIFNLAATFFIVFALAGNVQIASGTLGFMFFAQLAAVACFIFLVVRAGPAPSYRLAAGLFALGILGLVALNQMRIDNPIAWLAIPIAIAGLGRGGLNYIPWSNYNYMADVDEIVTGERREGVFAGVMTFVRKTAQALAVFLGGQWLAYGGFQEGSDTQSPQAITTILLVLSAAPLAILALGFLVSLQFKLNARTHIVLMDEIARFKTGERTPSSPQAKTIVEDLTGWSYDELWGRNTVGYRGRIAAATQS